MTIANGTDDDTRPSPWSVFFTPKVLTVLLILSAVLNFLLALTVQDLRRRVAKIEARGRLQETERVGRGFNAKDLEGKPFPVLYKDSAQPTVLYFYRKTCGWCTANLEGVRSLADQIHDRYRFLAVSLGDDDPHEYVQKHGLKFPVIWQVPADFEMYYKLGGTPQMLVVSPYGMVLKNWSGAWVPERQRAIEAFFDVKLPTLDLPAKSAPAKS